MPDDIERSERRDREVNACLSQIIPVIYGALLSYAMYSIAETALVIRDVIPRSGIDRPVIGFADGAQRLIIAAVILAYVISDVGELLRLDTRYKLKATARFSQEIWIALFYVLAFAYVRNGSYFAVVWLGASLALSGTWCNELKQEYREDEDKIANLAVALRFASYAGAAVFIPFGLKLCRVRPILTAKHFWPVYPYITWRPYAFTPIRTATFCVTWCTWWYFTESWAMFWSGPDTRRYLVRYLAPAGDQRLLKRVYRAALTAVWPLFRAAEATFLKVAVGAGTLGKASARLREGIEHKKNNLHS